MGRKREPREPQPKTPFDEIYDKIEELKDQIYNLTKRIEVLETRR